MSRRFQRRGAAVLAAAALTLAACSGNGTETSGDGVTLTWWHNGNADPLLSYWQDLADEFEADNPGVTVEIEAIQNEDLRTRLQVGLQSNDPPDLFAQWGGGEMADQVAADKLMDVSDVIPDAIESVGGSAAGWQVDGKTYGLPYTLGVVGFWYNTAMFADAGIPQPPATLDDLFGAIDKLKAAGIVPIAVGAADKWPAAHYWYYTAVRACSAETLQQAGLDFDFTDPCFVQAGEILQSIIDTEPFNEGFLATPAQQGATSSAGLLANGQAAMELMGHWNPIVMEGLTEDGKGLGEDLGWFPFPAVPDGEGAPDAAMGGGDGFSCSVQAPPECADLLAYIVSEDAQRRFGATGAGLPTAAGTQDSVEDPTMAQLLEYRDNAPFVQLYLDVAYGPNVGGALNDEVALMFAGQASPQDIVDAIIDASATR